MLFIKLPFPRGKGKALREAGCRCSWRLCAADGVVLAIPQNDLSYVLNDRLDRARVVVGNDAQSGVPDHPGVGEVQGLIEAALRDMVDTRDIGKGHPGIDAIHIT